MKILSGMEMLMLLVAVLTGCALSPQTVAIKTRVDVQSHPIGRGRPLALEVVDLRPALHFGYRGGVYDTALISPRTDVALAVHQALAERLLASEFIITAPQQGAPRAMRVEIQQIDYRASGKSVIAEVRVGAAVRVITHNQGQTLTTHYQADTARRLIGALSEQENEMMINEVVAQVLRGLLQDSAVLDLLAS